MIKVIPSSLSEMYVEWSDIAGDNFSVFRSNSPNDGFELTAANILVPFFVDNTVNLYDEGIHYYYKIEGYSGGNKAGESEVKTIEYHKADHISNKVIHESRVVLRVMDNPPVFVLIKKREGEPCPLCWNSITKKVRFANCENCNGTGTLIGYYPSIPIRISQDVSYLVDTSSMLDGDSISLTPVSAWISNTPLLSPGDIIVDVMNQRYEVNQVVRRTQKQYIIRQIIQMTPLEKGHPAYIMDVDRSVTINE